MSSGKGQTVLLGRLAVLKRTTYGSYRQVVGLGGTVVRLVSSMFNEDGHIYFEAEVVEDECGVMDDVAKAAEKEHDLSLAKRGEVVEVYSGNVRMVPDAYLKEMDDDLCVHCEKNRWAHLNPTSALVDGFVCKAFRKLYR